MNTVTNENNSNLNDLLLDDEEVYVEKKVVYPIKAILIIIASLIVVGIIGAVGVTASNKANYASQEQNLYLDADNTLTEWADNFESIKSTTIVIGEPQDTHVKSSLNKDLQELKRYSALSVIKMDGVKVDISKDKTWTFSKDGHVVHEGKVEK